MEVIVDYYFVLFIFVGNNHPQHASQVQHSSFLDGMCDVCGQKQADFRCDICKKNQCKECDKIWHQNRNRVNHERVRLLNSKDLKDGSQINKHVPREQQPSNSPAPEEPWPQMSGGFLQHSDLGSKVNSQFQHSGDKEGKNVVAVMVTSLTSYLLEKCSCPRGKTSPLI